MNLKDDNIIAVYHYGSFVYGTNSNQSDKDLIVVLEDIEKSKQFINDLLVNYDVSIYQKTAFQQLIDDHEISALECLFLKDEHIIKDYQWDFNLNLALLRNSISHKSSNSWVKAKKKFTVEKDYNPYIGQKSAWHAIRMLDFGSQIAQYGKITNYGSQNYVLTEIKKLQNWEDIDMNFRSLYNKTASVFRQNAPKELIQRPKM